MIAVWNGDRYRYCDIIQINFEDYASTILLFIQYFWQGKIEYFKGDISLWYQARMQESRARSFVTKLFGIRNKNLLNGKREKFFAFFTYFRFFSIFQQTFVPFWAVFTVVFVPFWTDFADLFQHTRTCSEHASLRTTLYPPLYGTIKICLVTSLWQGKIVFSNSPY